MLYAVVDPLGQWKENPVCNLGVPLHDPRAMRYISGTNDLGHCVFWRFVLSLLIQKSCGISIRSW